MFTQGRDQSVTKNGRYTEGLELSVTRLELQPSVVPCGSEHHVDDYNVTVHTRKGIIGD